MVRNKLGVREVERLRFDDGPGAPKVQRHNDGDGLSVLLLPDGGRFWRFRYVLHGKPGEMSLGNLDGKTAVSLAEARNRRDAAAKKVENGINPSKDRKQSKLVAAVDATNTFGALAEKYIAKKAKTWSPRYTKEVRANYENYLAKPLAREPIASITAPMVLVALQSITSACMQHKARSLASQIFQFAHPTYCSSDPASPMLRKNLEDHETTNWPTLKADKLPAFLTALDEYTGNPVAKMATQMSALTFLRRTELIRAQWDEVDFDNHLLTVPALRMKKTKSNKGLLDHVVPLAPQAMAILRELKRRQVNEYVFPGVNRLRSLGGKVGPIDKGAINKTLADLGYGPGVMCGHGFRGIASTMLAQHCAKGGVGFTVEVVEAALAHVTPGVAGVYRKADYLEGGTRATVMHTWADMLDRMRGLNVVAIQQPAEAQRSAA